MSQISSTSDDDILKPTSPGLLMSDREDNLYQAAFTGIGGFRFDEKVAQVFPDMIRRSVPGALCHWIKRAARRYAPNTVLYDLGCSLGATTLAIANQVTTPGCRIVAVDNSKAMLRKHEPVYPTA